MKGRMKLLLSITICWFATLCLKAETIVTVDGLKYSLSGGYASVFNIAGGNSSEDIIIPSSITVEGQTYIVNAIGNACFCNYYEDSRGFRYIYNDGIKETTTLYNSANSGSRALAEEVAQNSSYVKRVFLPNTIKAIGSYSFSNTNLISVELQDGIETIGAGAFNYSKITSLVISKDMKEFSSSYEQFVGCDLLRSIYYLGVTPPMAGCWVATSYTYVPDISAYSNYHYSIHDAQLIEMITFSNHEFDYTGEAPNVTWTNHVDGFTTSFEMPTLQSNVGTYEEIIPVTFTKDEKSFTAYIPYRYKIKAVKLTAKVINKEKIYGDENPQFETQFSGFVNGDNENSISNKGSYSTTASVNSVVGTYPINLSGAEAQNYYFEYEGGTLTVNKAPLTISVDNYTIKQGDAMPDFIIEYDGFKNGETKRVLTNLPTISCDATSASAPGTYPIYVSGATATNYDITHINGLLTVTDADPVTITANSYTINYGDAIPYFGYTSEGAELKGTPRITCSATRYSPVGTYPIVIEKGSVKNYNDSYVNGVLTIQKAQLTVTAQSYSRMQDEENPQLEILYSGFKNYENADVLNEIPVATTTATVLSRPGTYPIVVSGGASNNYNLNYVNGTLTIREAGHLTIDDTKIAKGGKMLVKVNLTNEINDFTAYQFDLVLPEGISLAKDETNQFIISLGDRYTENAHQIEASQIGTNKYRIICYSSSNSRIKNYSGTIAKITLKADGNLNTGDYDAIVENVVFTNSERKQMRLDDAQFSIDVKEVLPGDANNDGKINVADIVEIVNYILGTPSPRIVLIAADANGDEEINVTDVVCVVNLILSEDVARASTRGGIFEDNYYNDNLSLEEIAPNRFALRLSSSAKYVATQFDLHLADGQSFDNIVLNLNKVKDHQLLYVKLKDNVYRFLIYSLSNQPYEDGEGDLLSFCLSDNNFFVLEDIIFVTSHQNEKRFASVGGGAGTTDIIGVRLNEKIDIYSLDGKLIRKQAENTSGIPKGIYIVNGKKIIIK